MSSTNSQSKIKKGRDGVWRHPSGKPCSYEFHARMASADGGSLTAAASQTWATAAARWVKPGSAPSDPVAAIILNGSRALSAARQLRGARAALSADTLAQAGRDSTAWRAERARAALTAASREARNIGFRETANWKKR